MNQIESMIVAMIIGFSVVLIFRFVPVKASPFKSKKANGYLGQAFGILLFNLWPVLSDVPLVNSEGQYLYPLLGYLTVAGFFVYIMIAIKVDKRI